MLLVYTYVHVPSRSKKSFLKHVYVVIFPSNSFLLLWGKQINRSKLMLMSFLVWNVFDMK